MSKRIEKAKARPAAKWFAPPSGGYSGLGPGGTLVESPGKPPKGPASAEGVRRTQEKKGNPTP